MAKGESYREGAARARKDRAAFLKAYAANRDLDDALNKVGKDRRWLYTHTGKWADFRAAYQAIKRRGPAPGENKETKHSVDWDNTFAGFRQSFLHRDSPWFHVELCDKMDAQEGGDIMLVIWPPEHGKTSLIEDRCTMDLCRDPTKRITVGKSKIKFAEMVVSTVRSRLAKGDYGDDWWKLRERFGPFAPEIGMNAYGQPQVWSATNFNVFKRKLGLERDFNMQALGVGVEVAGTRTDRLVLDDPQSRQTLGQTDKILEILRDDWFTRPGVTGNTVILMNVVGDGDIAEMLIDDEVCDHVTVLKAYDPERYEALGPRLNQHGELEVSPWLWPERYSERDYDRFRRNAGPEGWARKYQQDWRPEVGRTFTQEMIDACTNPMRRLSHPPPKHPADKPAEIAVAIDPAFKRTAVCSAAFEPTIMRVLDVEAKTNLRSIGQMIDMVVDQVRHWHRPAISRVKWVIVETKGMQKGIITDDKLLELQAEYGFEIVEQVTGWDKNDEDFGVSSMARSMARGELDFPYADDESRARFESLFREMKDWRPTRRDRRGHVTAVHGNALKQDELMAVWFLYTRWHKQRRKSIRRGSDSAQFGFSPIPAMAGAGVLVPAAPALLRPEPNMSGWRFG